MSLLQPAAFRDPQSVDPTRPTDRYLASDGPARCLGTDFSAKVCDSLAVNPSSMLKAFAVDHR